MTNAAELGLIGLGVMGKNLALNIASHGYKIAVYDNQPSVCSHFQTQTREIAGIDCFTNL